MLFDTKKNFDNYTFGTTKGWNGDPCCFLIRHFYSEMLKIQPKLREDQKVLKWENIMKEGAYVYKILFGHNNYYFHGQHLVLVYDRSGDRENRYLYRIPLKVNMRKVLNKSIYDFRENELEEVILKDEESLWKRERRYIQYIRKEKQEKNSVTYPNFTTLLATGSSNHCFFVVFERYFFTEGILMMAKLGDFLPLSSVSSELWNRCNPPVDVRLFFPTEMVFRNYMKQFSKNWDMKKIYNRDYSHLQSKQKTSKRAKIAGVMKEEVGDILERISSLFAMYGNSGRDMNREVNYPLKLFSDSWEIDMLVDTDFKRACEIVSSQWKITSKFTKKLMEHMTNFWKKQLLLEYSYVKDRDNLTREVREAPGKYMNEIGTEMVNWSPKAIREFIDLREKIPGTRGKVVLTYDK